MNNIMVELVTELKNVQKHFNCIVEYNNNCGDRYELYRDVEDSFPANVSEYCIITGSGIQYVINNSSEEFYNINMDDIIYVYKHLKNEKYSNWDSINGYYNDWNLLRKTLNSFSVVEKIHDFFD